MLKSFPVITIPLPLPVAGFAITYKAMYDNWTLLFWNMILLKYPGLPNVAASETKTPEFVFTPLMRIQLAIVQFTKGVVPVEPSKRMFGAVTDVFEMVRFRVEPPAVLDPSMVV